MINSDSEFFILVIFGILLNLKHLICEFILQTPNIANYKIRYGTINSFIHILHHAFGTLVICLLLKFNISLVLGLVIAEAIVHYHVDWIHMRFGSQSYKDKRYWQWLGTELFIHHMIYITMIVWTSRVLT